MYDSEKGRGIRKKSIPAPMEIELPLDSSPDDVLMVGRENFFDEIHPSLSSLALAESGGSRLHIKDKETWTLGGYFKSKSLKPSRYKLYIMYTPYMDVSINITLV